ncbi:hypothetical protein F0U60_10320 [Archangium minus]|uniref:Uncharacterized protein n=1 Tax=Archangium minus TaxID=83450 RepID=A0ABY9WKU8_9BACT|nr:hypothetical protein F0U60_10320 [Archangium minus]
MASNMNDKKGGAAAVPGTEGTLLKEAMNPTTGSLVATAMPTDPSAHDGIKDPPVINGTGFEPGLA